MISTVDIPMPGHPITRKLRRAATTLAVAACAASLPSLAGQASVSFGVTITVLPAGPGSCTALLGSGGTPQVNCRPVVSGTGAAGGSDRQVGGEPVLGYRLPDTRARLAGAVVEVGEESFYAWGEYSSRIIAGSGVEYVEMTVTW
jgi:hypothetical protein